MRKYFVILSSVFLYLCFGANYAWSVFAQELADHYNFSMAQSQLPFSVFQVSFPIALILGGRFLERIGPVVFAFTGSLLFGGGFILAGLLPLSNLNLIITFGIISGTGMGLAYTAPAFASQKNFPDKISIVTGIGFGAHALSTVIISLLTEYILKTGWNISKIFIFYGLLFLVTGCLASFGLFITHNKANNTSGKAKIKLSELLTSKMYWALTIPFFAGLYTGLMISSNIKTIGIQWGIVPVFAAIGIPLFALFNAAGRIMWGYVAHIITEEKLYKISLLIQTAVLFLGAFFIRDPYTLIIFAAISGFTYGSHMVLVPSMISKTWGIDAFGRIYPVVLMANIFAGFISPTLGGKISDISGNYFWALIFAGIISLIAYIVFRKIFSLNQTVISKTKNYKVEFLQD